MLKITRELTFQAAAEAVMRAGGKPTREAVESMVEQSRIKQAYKEKVISFLSTDEYTTAGYRISLIEII